MPDRDSGTDALIGRTLDDRYRLEARIGGGGMGAVFRARHLMMDTEVAIKVLRPDLAADPAAVRRFAREAKGSFRFDHPNCVRVFDFGFAAAEGVVYLVMEHLDGRTIGAELDVDGPMAPPRVVHIARQVAAALAHAHEVGLVHRDLKPDNVMLLMRGSDPDFVKVLDFGLAKLFEPDSSGTSIFSVAPLTQDGIVFGTPEYMSPEQATGQKLHPASDLYSLGVVMYQMLTGQLPLLGGSFMATLTKQVRETPIPPDERRPELAIPTDLSQLVMRCLAKPVASRPASADQLGRELGVISERLASKPSRLSPTLAACDTMELSTSALAASPPSAAATAALTTTARHRASRRGLLIASALAVVLLAGGLALVATLGGRSGSAPQPTAAEAAPIVAAPGPPADAARPARPVDAGLDAAPAPAPAVRDHPKMADPRVAQHLAAAEQARRDGKTLKQIAEADSALRLDRHSRQAAYLLGDGLLTSGDKVRGCRYLARARGLARARQRYRNAGCK